MHTTLCYKICPLFYFPSLARNSLIVFTSELTQEKEIKECSKYQFSDWLMWYYTLSKAPYFKSIRLTFQCKHVLYLINGSISPSLKWEMTDDLIVRDPLLCVMLPSHIFDVIVLIVKLLWWILVRLILIIIERITIE